MLEEQEEQEVRLQAPVAIIIINTQVPEAEHIQDRLIWLDILQK